MVEEIVNSILEAEDRADAIQREAKAQAKQMVEDARLASENLRETYLKKYKVDIKQGISVSTQAAETVYREMLEAGEAEMKHFLASCEKNTDLAVKEITRSVLG